LLFEEKIYKNALKFIKKCYVCIAYKLKVSSMEKKVKKKIGLGMGAPAKSHQRVVGRAFFNLLKMTPEEYRNNFALDTTLDVVWKDGEKKIRPDITFYNLCENNKDKTLKDVLFVLEVVNNNGVRYSTERIRDIFKRESSFVEGFIYNYEKESWTRYAKKNGGMDNPKNTSYSLTFKCNIAFIVEDGIVGKPFMNIR
jgi:hypothetical protein